MKFKTSSILLLGILISWPLELLYAEQLTITTYYPSPYGSYSELQLYPHNDNPPSNGPNGEDCTPDLEGTLYYNSYVDDIYFCNGDEWVNTGQASEYWDLTSDDSGDIYDINQQDVRVKNRLMVGIGDIDLSSSRPANALTVITNGSPGVSIGHGAAAVAPPNGMLVLGTVGLGTSIPALNAQLDVSTGLPVAIRTNCVPSTPGGGCLGLQSQVGVPSGVAILGQATVMDATPIWGDNTGSSNNPGVAGTNSAGGDGVYGRSTAGGNGVAGYAYGTTGMGVYGEASQPTWAGVGGQNNVGYGVAGSGHIGVIGLGYTGAVGDRIGVYGIGFDHDFYGFSGERTEGGHWQDGSDRNIKENFTPVDHNVILSKIIQLPITQWNFKSDKSKGKHIGAVGQDFYAVFGLGSDDKHISAADTAGIALLGIKALNKKISEQAEEIRVLKSHIEKLEQKIVQ